MNLVHLPGPPFGIPVALPHAPGTPSEPSKNRSKRKTEILKSAQFFHQKSSPGELLPIQDPPKRAPLDPCHFPEGPLGNFWGTQRTSWDPPWPPLRICKTEFKKKTFFFSKNAETTIFISSRAFRVKRQWSQNHVFHVLGPPWSPPGPEPFFSRPPRGLPKRTLELQGRPEILPRGPRSLQGPDQIYKVGISNPRKYVYLASRDLKKTLSDHFSRLRVPPRGPPVSRP